jgi:predicted 3-demethylubiquinone-9 3-methyltransferase (glyoxalase superfamily)
MRTVPIIDTVPFDLFLDLDGVFADFEGKFFEITGQRVHEVEKKMMWKIIYSHPEFFYSLDLMKDAEHLWAYTRQYNPTFLSGLPAKQGAKNEKIRWVADKFGEEWTTIVLPKREKQLYSGPNKVLVDDNHSNINEWVSKGGHGIFHSNVWETIERLEELRHSYQ